MKNLFLLLAIVTLFGACCNSQKNQEQTANITNTAECTSITIDSFLRVAPEYVGKELTVKGTVDHVCKHGGKRVKIFGSNPDQTIHGEATEAVGTFNAELEGSDVCLTGIVAESKMDLAYVEEYEKSIIEALEKESEEAEMEHAKGVDHHTKLEQIKVWKEEIATNGKGYISSYYLDVTKYHECNTEIINNGCGHKNNDTVANGEKATAPCSSKEATPCGGKNESKPCGSNH
jgi:hypothetical protein